MSNIVRVPNPTAGTVPAGGTDFQKQNDLLYTHGLLGMGANPINLANNKVVKGAVFQIGGVHYRATADEPITGTPSNYVKITRAVGGADCTASYVASLTGVSWSDTYNGYVDGAGELYLFDEALAVASGVITSPKTSLGSIPATVMDHRITTGVARTETMNALKVGQTALVQWSLQITSGASGTCYLQLPAGGTYHVSLTTRHNATNNAVSVLTSFVAVSGGAVAGGSSFGNDTTANGSSVEFFGFVRRIS